MSDAHNFANLANFENNFIEMCHFFSKKVGRYLRRDWTPPPLWVFGRNTYRSGDEAATGAHGRAGDEEDREHRPPLHPAAGQRRAHGDVAESGRQAERSC